MGKTSVARILRRTNDFLIGGFAGPAAAVALGAAAIIVGSQVISRYVFDYSFSWSSQAAQYLGDYSVMLGSAYAYRASQHIAVTVMVERLRGLWRRVGLVGINLGTLWFAVVVLWSGALLTISTYQHQVISAGLRVPMWSVYLAVPLGAILLILASLESLATGQATWVEEEAVESMVQGGGPSA